MIGTEVEVVRGVECVRAVMEGPNIAQFQREMGNRFISECSLCPVAEALRISGHHARAFAPKATANYNSLTPECSPCTKRGGVYVPLKLSPLLRMRSNNP